jgi:uncharacterized membrane protein
MLEAVTDELRFLTQSLEAIGAFALILGFVISTIICVLEISRKGAKEAIENYRKAIGRTVLIGLEILVAATIIKTIFFDRTLENMGLLAIMVAIRTALGWSMVLEMYGCWPWQKKKQPLK